MGVTILLAACAPAPAPTPVEEPSGPSVTVSDQAVIDDSITLTEVVSDGPGWIVIHAQQDGAPGPVVGYAQVMDGSNLDVVVNIDITVATETLYAMLHTDAGEEGVYEFPGDDTPVSVDDAVVMTAFMADLAGE